jgi:hypothetical protein
MALAVLIAFTIGFAPGLAQAGIAFSPTYLGSPKIVGTVEEGNPGYVLKSSKGTFRLTGANASKWVGQKVEVWGELSRDETTMVETINVDKFTPK